MIIGMNHAGMVVRDLEKAVEFYRDVMGLRVVSSLERRGDAISQVLGYENTRLKGTHMGIGDAPTIELIQYLNPLPSERPTEERSVLGAGHVAFDVDDIGIGEAPADDCQRVHVADVAEKLVAQSLSLMCSAHQSRDVNEGDRRRCHLLRSHQTSKHPKPGVRNRHHPAVRLNRGEWIRRHAGAGLG